jgi:hypothetical protein
MIGAVLPLLLAAGGVVALVAGFAILQSLGPGYRLGRILSTTPTVPVAEALRMIAAGERRYVAIEGRIDSDDEFEDAAHNPLVLRRTRLSARIGRRWTRFEDGLEVVPFEVRDGLDGIAVDTASLGDGLVVMSRISKGVVRDLGGRAPAALPPGAPALVTIDQVSSVEHARVLGWPASGPDGRPMMTAGAGRPLVLSTLETGDAMRVLAGGERLRPRLAAVAFATAALLLGAGLLVGVLGAIGVIDAENVASVRAADAAVVAVAAADSAVASVPADAALADGSPDASVRPAPPSPIPSTLSGDTRSSGEGPGLVGAPGAAIVGVLVVGLASVAATLLYVRVTGGPRAR